MPRLELLTPRKTMIQQLDWKRPPTGMQMAVPKNRFPPGMTLNYDETPIPFEYLDGCTYATTGSHTVGGKSDRSEQFTTTLCSQRLSAADHPDLEGAL
jgi:hypothetical protein